MPLQSDLPALNDTCGSRAHHRLENAPRGADIVMYTPSAAMYVGCMTTRVFPASLSARAWLHATSQSSPRWRQWVGYSRTIEVKRSFALADLDTDAVHVLEEVRKYFATHRSELLTHFAPSAFKLNNLRGLAVRLSAPSDGGEVLFLQLFLRDVQIVGGRSCHDGDQMVGEESKVFAVGSYLGSSLAEARLISA